MLRALNSAPEAAPAAVRGMGAKPPPPREAVGQPPPIVNKRQRRRKRSTDVGARLFGNRKGRETSGELGAVAPAKAGGRLLFCEAEAVQAES